MESENLKLSKSPYIVTLLIIAIALGISFRFLAIDRKLYWHDEVYTSMRAAGFRRQEIDRELFQNQLIYATELQKYQQIKPNTTNADTIQSLIIEDPQHPPLYFLIARQWLTWFGSSINVSRFLPVLLSLLALPLIYGLAIRLFSVNNSNSKLVALISTAFLALSPFDILFAQTARQYSLLAVGIIGTSYALLRALQSQSRQFNSWLIYSLGVAIALYTHPFFGLTLIGHGVFILGSQCQQLKNFILATGLAIALYLPWLIVLITNFSRTTSTTSWSSIPVGIDYLLKLWSLSFTSLFFDLDFGFNNPWTYILRMPLIVLIIASLYFIYRHSSSNSSLSYKTNNQAKWFIFTSVFVPFLLLLLPDLILGGKRSAVSRYLISCFPAIQLAMAYLFAQMLMANINIIKVRIWQVIFATVLTASIISNLVSANSYTWWSKDLSYYNAQVSDRLNAISHPIVISDIGDDFTNTGDLISMSYSLNPDVKLLLLNQTLVSSTKLIQELSKYSDPIYVFRPSLKLFKSLKLQDPKDKIFPEGQLWKLNSN
jgi:uncharacterized membrane protein